SNRLFSPFKASRQKNKVQPKLHRILLFIMFPTAAVGKGLLAGKATLCDLHDRPRPPFHELHCGKML
ncbi:MAG: hypothetical protein LBQ33_00325, partial [Oscillospiraceae bacterium]|nr:hypothetical protein [Oscillospiraceae bacterium]